MNCEEIRQALLDSLDGLSADGPSLAVESHISNCEACRRFVEVQRMIDARLAAAVPAASLSPAFRRGLREKLSGRRTFVWPEYLPDVAHLSGCAAAMVLLLLLLPKYSGAVVPAGLGFTAVTYFLQAVMRNYSETRG
jgi:predicted anti-sigma-YlaC factor YlaD